MIEAVGLMTMVERLDEIIDSLTAQIGDLRDQLAAYRVEPPPSILGDKPRLAHRRRCRDVASLQQTFDQLHELADALWFETQWLRAELAAARERT